MDFPPPFPAPDVPDANRIQNSVPDADPRHEYTELLETGSTIQPSENTNHSETNRRQSHVHDVPLPIPNPVYYNLESEESGSDESDDETPKSEATNQIKEQNRVNNTSENSKSEYYNVVGAD